MGQIKPRRSERKHTPTKFEGFYKFSLLKDNDYENQNNNEFFAENDDTMPSSLSSKSKNRIYYNYFYDESDEETDESDCNWLSTKQRVKKSLKSIRKRRNHLKSNRRSNKLLKKNKFQENSLYQLVQWKKEIQQKSQINPLYYKQLTTNDITKIELDKHANNIQAIFINANLIPSNLSKQQEKVLKEQYRNDKLLKVRDLSHLKITKKLIKNGIIFVWSEKSCLDELMDIMDKDFQFQYIENFQIIQMSQQKIGEKLQINQNFNDDDFLNILQKTSNDIDPIDVLCDETIDRYPLASSKKVLMMFRKFDSSQQLELRHQRTSDVIFDIVNEQQKYQLDWRTKEYVYNLIETLLPKAQINFVIENTKASEKAKQKFDLKLIELFADIENPREGWIQICQN